MTFIMPSAGARIGEALNFHGVESDLLPAGLPPTAKFDFNLSAVERPGSLTLRRLYNASLLKATTIRRLHKRFLAVLEEASLDPDGTE